MKKKTEEKYKEQVEQLKRKVYLMKRKNQKMQKKLVMQELRMPKVNKDKLLSYTMEYN